MRHIHVAALESDAEIAKALGKKSSESDFAMYNYKQEGEVLCTYFPTKYPEKIQPLLYCLSLCDIAYIRPKQIDKNFGEMLLATSFFGKKLIVACDVIGKEEIEPLLAQAEIQKYEFFEGNVADLRQKLLSQGSLRTSSGSTQVIIDSCFPVKGVGTVALGIVQLGKVFVHQKLSIFPSGIQAEVRSIQVQDENVEEAEAGSRVGLNLKGVAPDQVEKGDLACQEEIACTTKVQASLFVSKFYKKSVEESQFFALFGLKTALCKAKKVQENYEIEFNSTLCLKAKEQGCMFVPQAIPRVVGMAKVVSI